MAKIIERVAKIIEIEGISVNSMENLIGASKGVLGKAIAKNTDIQAKWVSVIAEKFEAFVSLGLVNSRYKDFYDIYILINKFDLSGYELKEAIKETFSHFT